MNGHRNITSNLLAELLTIFLLSFKFDMCGPIGTILGCIGRSEDNLVVKKFTQFFFVNYTCCMRDRNKSNIKRLQGVPNPRVFSAQFRMENTVLSKNSLYF